VCFPDFQSPSFGGFSRFCSFLRLLTPNPQSNMILGVLAGHKFVGYQTLEWLASFSPPPRSSFSPESFADICDPDALIRSFPFPPDPSAALPTFLSVLFFSAPTLTDMPSSCERRSNLFLFFFPCPQFLGIFLTALCLFPPPTFLQISCRPDRLQISPLWRFFSPRGLAFSLSPVVARTDKSIFFFFFLILEHFDLFVPFLERAFSFFFPGYPK